MAYTAQTPDMFCAYPPFRNGLGMALTRYLVFHWTDLTRPANGLHIAPREKQDLAKRRQIKVPSAASHCLRVDGDLC
jgi:hypothetical protein